MQEENKTPKEEDAAARAKRLIALVRVRLKEQTTQRAGAEAFHYWLRQDAEKHA
ncbi:MAG: hypothetical protein ABSF70_02210 [Terracidiphilus sp.]